MAFDIVIGTAPATASGFDIAIGDVAVAPTLAAGTTLAAMQAGSFVPVFTAAIEGYDSILTDNEPELAVDAWYHERAASHYTQAIGACFVELENEQMLDPNNPFPRGGRCVLHVQPTPDNDRFGIDTHKRGGARTELTATIDHDATTINVKSTNGFPSSGEAYIGTECFAYTGTTATSFTGVTRGKYAPFPNGGTSVGFGHYHRAYTVAADTDAKLSTYVCANPPTWIGKWVGVWMHKMVDGVLNAKDDAQLVYAGRIVSITQGKNRVTIVELEHILDVVQDAYVAPGDPFRGKIRNTIQLQEGMHFTMLDKRLVSGGGVFDTRTAGDLVVTAGASNAYEIEPGLYTAQEIYAALNLWWADARNGSDLFGWYSIGDYLPDDGSVHSFVYWQHNTSASTQVWFELTMPGLVASQLGFTYEGIGKINVNTFENFIIVEKSGPQKGDGIYSRISEQPRQRWIGHTGSPFNALSGNPRLSVVDEIQGAFVDQYDFLPSSVKPVANASLEWGIFVINEQFLAFGAVDGSELSDLTPMPQQFGLEGVFGNDWYKLPLTQKTPEYVTIRQVLILEMRLDAALPSFLLSTGTEDYNDATYDVLPYGVGLGIPKPLATGAFTGSLLAMPGAAAPIAIFIDKSTRFADLFAGDLLLRRTSFRWDSANAQLGMVSWRTPTAAHVVATLAESNKAAPVGVSDPHHSTTVENGEWARPIVKIEFDRSAHGNTENTDGYRSRITLYDGVAIDESGGKQASLTIRCRNTYSEFYQTGLGIDALIPGYLASMPYFARPARQSTRSIDSRYFEGLSIGDIVAWGDNEARDPETGLPGVATRYAVVMRHRATWGGLVPGADKPTDMGGEVDLFMLDVNNTALYVPGGQVDHTATNAGYIVATKVATLFANKFSDTGVDADKFLVGYKVKIIERDPSDPTSALTHDDVVAAQSGNTITLTTGFAAFDNTKKYYVLFDAYADCTTAQQQNHTFQADDADGLVVDTRSAYEYGIGGASGSYTAWHGDDDVELPPNSVYADGFGRDVAHDVALARLVNNFHNYKSANHSPLLSNAQLNGSWALAAPGATWKLVRCEPIHLSDEIILNHVWRKLWVAPFYRSSDGSPASLRVSLCAKPPLGDGDLYDVSRGSVFSDATFTTSSTSYLTAGANSLSAIVKGIDGIAWLYIECHENCETYGLGLCYESEIQY